MYVDCADYSELKTGNRATGLIFSSSSMNQKFGWTIGFAIYGLSEYARATGDATALDYAIRLFRSIEAHSFLSLIHI